MINLVGKLPEAFIVACSGGVDSMAMLSFFCNRKTRPSVAYFNHGTEHSQKTESFVRKYCEENELALYTRGIKRERNKNESLEEYWRNERYSFFRDLPGPVATAHNLDDCVETWIFTSLHGNPKIIPYRNQNVFRPFLATPKSDLIAWCAKNNIPHSEDESNKDVRFCRNRIRHRIVPEALLINPGLRTVIKKKIILREKEGENDVHLC